MNKVYAIGIPKSGTNAVEKVLTLLEKKPKRLHTSDYKLADDNKVVFIYRNPRNVLISGIRYYNHQMRYEIDTITEEKMRMMLFDFMNTSLYSYYDAYYRWLSSNACIIRFVDLVEKKETIDKIQSYLMTNKNSQFIFDNLYGGTGTWTGEFSDWKLHWTDSFDKLWEDEGMKEMENKWGFYNG